MKPQQRQALLDKLRAYLNQLLTHVVALHSKQNIYRRLREVFQANPALRREWTQLHSFIFGGYEARASITVRRLTDRHRSSVSLATIANCLCDHPNLVTRADYLASVPQQHVCLAGTVTPQIQQQTNQAATRHLQDEANRQYDQFAGPRASQLDPVRAQLTCAEDKCKRVRAYVNKRLAHLDRKKPPNPTWGDLDDAIDAVGQLYRYLALLLTGSAPAANELSGTWQGAPWEPLLTIPWAPRNT